MANERTKIEIDDMITVGSLAESVGITVSRLIAELMKNGIMATVNERIDFDTAEIIVVELDLNVELVRHNNTEAVTYSRPKSISDKAVSRPPVVAVMGHVDHGKTSLLDAIRSSHIASTEAGGITQHISAYQVKHKDRIITFLDTPGHEAFAAIRQHGAHLTDIVIIVVAADDGIKPQTIEAIRFARKAGVKIIVAANKIDKEGADVNRLKQQLSEQDLLIEEWGGDTIIQEVSAKTKQGINELLDMVLLVSDVEELKADIDVPAKGLIIESHIEVGRGPVAHALVEAGELKAGSFVIAGSTYAKIRNLESTDNVKLKQAGPSTPVIITGFKNLPEFGDEFRVVQNEKEARQQSILNTITKQDSGKHIDIGSSELIKMINYNNQVQELNIIIKADVQGSLTSVIDSLKTLDTDEVAIRIVSSGVGSINDNDVTIARSSSAIIYGFNVSFPAASRQYASRDTVKVKTFKVIYELLDDAKEELSKLLRPEIVESSLGTIIIKGIFKTTKNEVICGGEVVSGKLTLPAIARIKHDQEEVECEVTNLKKGPENVREVHEGELCGINLKTIKKLNIVEGDKIELLTRHTVQRTL